MSGRANSSISRRALLKAASTSSALGFAGCINQIRTPADVADTGVMAQNIGYFVDPSWALERFGELEFIDARRRSDFRAERIYGAVRPDFDKLTAKKEINSGVLPDSDKISGGFSDVLLDSGDDVVVYGSSVGSRVTRVVFALEYLGHSGEIYVLNGGFDAWNGRIGTGIKMSGEQSSYHPSINNDLVATREWISENALGNDSVSIIDARSERAYLGNSDSGDVYDRPGHIPGAMNIFWHGNIKGRLLQDASHLGGIYIGSAGLSQDGKVVVYCREGVNSTNTYVVLKALGFEDVMLYEGGFIDWSNVDEGERDIYPVETKSNAIIEVEGEVGGGGGTFTCSG